MEHVEHHEEHELIGYGTYVSIWLGLLILTSLTVAVAGFDLGAYTTLVALFIAAIKTSLVLLYFMHLRYEKKVIIGLICVAVFIMVIIAGIMSFDDYRFISLSSPVVGH